MRPTRGKTVIAGGVVIALMLLYPLAYAQESVSPSQAGKPASSQPDATDRSASSPSSAAQLPDSPGSVQAGPSQAQANGGPQESVQSGSSNPIALPAPTNTAPSSSGQTADQSGEPQQASGQANSQSSTQAQQQPEQSRHQPVGTAAAESIPTTGIAASRPAGAAVAPAKQRRVRSLLIKVGVVVGAGVAAGTTMALSKGSPSKPPGAH